MILQSQQDLPPGVGGLCCLRDNTSQLQFILSNLEVVKNRKTFWLILVMAGISTSMFAQDFWTRNADFPGPGA